ncbi:MAG: ribonucleoside triphosphate reductase, partial [Candidatus Aenigmarchaeota archaeon]|nr:ribonucleoside triphosphate reductase [Candidatus Aenigmarchaeota archaeon]
MRKILGSLGVSSYVIEQKTGLHVRVESDVLRNALEKWCGHLARNKKIPEFILYNKDKKILRAFLDGYITGDGVIETKKRKRSGPRVRMATVSKVLALQLQLLCARLGIFASICKIKKKKSFIGKREVKGEEIYEVSYPLNGSQYVKSMGKYFLTPIRLVKNVKYKGKVFNLETSDHTYLLNNVVVHNCVGWDLRDLLLTGFTGVKGKITSKPAKHFRVALLQAVNFLYTLQGEAAGAQAFSNFDTFLAPFIRYDKLSYRDVKQALQEFMFNMNVPTRVGSQTPFTNITLDLKVPSFMKNEPIIIGGKVINEVYGDFQEEMNIFNKALAEVMLEGDGVGRVFTFPIPTINITKDFDWESAVVKKVFETSAKYGIPYFANFINSDMKTEDVRSMCCRLTIDKRELRKRGGGLFGANPLTGSIGVVTINMPRIGYLSKDEDEFFERLSKLMELAKESLEIKRRVLEDFTERGLYPYSKFYLRNVKQAFGEYWKNHFNTIGLIGMNEACLNFLGCSIGEKEGYKFAIKVLDFMRSKLIEFQEETGNMYNLEATPAEGSLAPEEKVLICQSDPKLVEIGPLVDQYLAKNKEKVQRFGTSEVLKLSEGEMFTYGFSRKNGKIKKYPVTALVRHKGRSMYEVETFSGRKVRVTGQHSLFTLNERGEIEEILVRELRKNTPIAIPKNLEMEEVHKEFNLFKSFQNSSFKALLYIILPEEVVKSLLNVEKVRRWVENHYNFSFKDVKYMWKKSKALPLTLFYDLGINLPRKILKNSKIFYRKTKNTKPINVFLPINHDLGFIIGVILSEGWIGDQIQISITDRELIEVTKRKSEKIFGSKVTSISVLKKRGNRKRKYILTFSKMASIVLKHVVGLEGKSDERKIPSYIFFSSKRAIQGVLKGFSLGDGSLYINKEKGHYSFRLYTNSSDLANHLNILLLRLGILSKIRKEKKSNPKWKDNYVLSITGIENLRKYFKFVLEEPLGIKGKGKNSGKEVLSFNLDLIKSIMKKHSIKPEDIGIHKDSFNRNV